MKKRSSGILIHDENFLLMGHSTGNDFYDIPKGVIHEGEDTFDTMIRETHEEFNINLDSFLDQITSIGELEYSRYKDLVLYELKCDYLDLKGNQLYINNEVFELSCSSYFTISTVESLEIDSYSLIDVRSLNDNTCRSFYNMTKKYNLL